MRVTGWRGLGLTIAAFAAAGVIALPPARAAGPRASAPLTASGLPSPAADLPGASHGRAPFLPLFYQHSGAASSLRVAAVSPTELQLSWPDSSTAAGLQIERSDGGPFRPIGAVGAGVGRFLDTGLSPDTAYAYRLRAASVSGDPEYSAEVLATTLPTPGGIAAFHPATGEWAFHSGHEATLVSLGESSDEPVPADYLGRGTAQIGVYRRAEGMWLLCTGAGTRQIPFGGPEDEPVPGDYLGAGHAQIAVMRPSTHEWFILGDDGRQRVLQFGGTGDRAAPADYLGTGHPQIAVYRPATGQWFIRREDGTQVVRQLDATDGDPVPGDYLGTGHAQPAVFQSATHQWLILDDEEQQRQIRFGDAGDQPIPWDYFGLGHVQVAVFRPGTGEGLLRTDAGSTVTVPFGEPGDRPIPAAYSVAVRSWAGLYGGSPDAGAFVARTAEEWKALWQRIGAEPSATAIPPGVDFNRFMVLAVFMGEQRSGGYSIAIEIVVPVEQELVVTVREQAPAADAITTQALTRPFHIIVVKRSALPVRFVRAADDDEKGQAGF